MGRSPCCAKEGLNRGAWTAIEDKILTDYIKLHGEGRWRGLPKSAGLKRCGKSCRLRWLNYLRPDIKRGNISIDEEDLIVRLHKLLGNRWSLIAGRLPGRTDNEIKNYWNTNLGKKVQDGRKESNTKTTTTNPFATTVQPRIQIPNPVVVPIRTKAVKCTRAVIISSPPTIQTPTPIPMAPVTCNGQVAGPTPDAANTNTKRSKSSLVEGGPQVVVQEDFSALDLSMIGGGELNFSEFLNSPYLLEMYREAGPGEDHDQLESSKLEEPIFFPEEMMEDWRRSGCGIDDASVVLEYLLGD